MSRILYNTKWVKLKESKSGFQFLERKGVNSIAVLLLKIENNELFGLVRKQPLCALSTKDKDQILGNCPITGSIDMVGEEFESPETCAIREVEEEAGYKISKIHDLGTYIVGTQTNEKCHCYISDVTGMANDTPMGDGSEDEAMSYNVWVPFKDILSENYSGLVFICSRIMMNKDKELDYLLEYIK